MHRVPLKEYKMPRILAVDFTKQEVMKISEAGFNIKRAYSGLHDNNEYCIPADIQDIEIVLLKYEKGTFEHHGQRKKHENSIPDDFDFHLVIKETLDKRGWVIIFIAEDSSPTGLQYLSIRNLGLIKTSEGYVDASKQKSPHPPIVFPKFKGDLIHFRDDDLGILLKRFYNSGKWILLQKTESVVIGNTGYPQGCIISDDAASPSVLAIEVVREFVDIVSKGSDSSGAIIPPLRFASYGGLIILPDFGEKNIDVGLAIIQEYLSKMNPRLFSEQMHEWLKSFRPESVKQLYKKWEGIEASMKKEIEAIDKKIELEEEKYLWLDMLLISGDDDFKDAVGIAMRFLGFKVKDIDKSLAPKERKHEDFNITDPYDNSFFIVEAKATKRGASEGFITKTQNHQGSYSRRYNCSIPDAILIVNHSSDLNPSQRSGRFYADADVLARLKDQNIKAVDSISLHSLCQKVFAGKMDKEKARDFVKNISGAISGEI